MCKSICIAVLDALELEYNSYKLPNMLVETHGATLKFPARPVHSLEH